MRRDNSILQAECTCISFIIYVHVDLCLFVLTLLPTNRKIDCVPFKWSAAGACVSAPRLSLPEHGAQPNEPHERFACIYMSRRVLQVLR